VVPDLSLDCPGHAGCTTSIQTSIQKRVGVANSPTRTRQVERCFLTITTFERKLVITYTRRSKLIGIKPTSVEAKVLRQIRTQVLVRIKGHPS
jgi:hypothetical protein